MRKFIPFLIGGIALYSIIRLKRAGTIARNAQFSIEKMNVDVKKRQINLIMGILNPASGSIKINSVVGYLYFNGQSIASVENFTSMQVTGNNKSMLNLVLRPSAMGLINLIVDFVKKKQNKEKATANVRFTGTANVDGIAIPIDSTLVDA